MSATGPGSLVPVYVIALDGSRRADRLFAELDRQDVRYQRIEAVDGTELSADWLAGHHDAELAAARLGRPMGRGEIGCALSHRSVYETMMRDGERSAIVLEEDAILAPDFHRFWRAAGRLSGFEGVVSLHADFGFASSAPAFDIEGFAVHRALTTLYSTAGYWLSIGTAAALYRATEIISHVADWPLDGAALNHHVVVPELVSHNFTESLLERERVRFERPARGLSERLFDLAMRLTFLKYLTQRRRYLSRTHFFRTEVAPVFFRNLGWPAIKFHVRGGGNHRCADAPVDERGAEGGRGASPKALR